MFYRSKSLPIVCLIFFLGLMSLAAAAQDQTGFVRPEISFSGVDGEILLNIEKQARLFARLKDSSPLSKGEFRRLKRNISKEVQAAVRPFGYYLAQVSLLPTKESAKLSYRIDLNEPVRIKKLSLSVIGDDKQKNDFKAWLSDYPLTTGQVLNQAVYEREKKALISRALRLGYFDAKLVKSEIIINQARTLAEISIRFVTGSQYSISQVNLSWQTADENSSDLKRRIQDSLLSSYISVSAGDVFNADELVTTQKSLLATPYFTGVSVQAGATDSDSATLPINVVLTPRRRHTYSAEVGVGTDTGVRGGIGYENRRLNSRGHNLSARVGGSEIKRSAIINYQIPRKRSAKDNVNLFIALEEEFGDTRRFESSKFGIERLRSMDDTLLKFGLTASRERFLRLSDDEFEIEQTTDLLLPSVKWEHSDVDDLYFPNKGWSASATLRGASKSAGSDIDLGQFVFAAKGLFPLGDGRVKLRVKLAGSLIDEAVNLPESLGFLAGGDDSVRGYRFESIGVDRNGETGIGKNLISASAEYQHPLKNDISLAAFFDAGDAFNGSADYKKGTGLGLRWRLPFGALRLDVASALDKEGKPLRLHFSFGTDL